MVFWTKEGDEVDISTKLTVGSDAPGAKLFLLGNEAIARGAIEGGVQVVAGYPGTPSTEITETMITLAKDRDLKVQWSVNEKVAFGVAMGASLCGIRAMAVMKHVGVNLVLDPLLTASYIGAIGGLVLVEAEDPGQWSSQNEQDNRYIAELAYIPVLEPSSPQEAKDMMADIFRLSEEFHQPFMFRSVTRIGHARGDITLGPLSSVKRTGSFHKNKDKLVMLPAVARKNRKLMIERMAKIKEAVDTLPYNQLQITNGAKLGIITAGISYSYTLEALSMLGLREQVSILKIGTPYPPPEKLIREMLSSVSDILVIEELEPFLEGHTRIIAQKSRINVVIHGKDVLPLDGEYSTRKVAEALSKLTGVQSPINFSGIDFTTREVSPLLPGRPPNLCAGCPHRASMYAINIAVSHIKKETGTEPVLPGDIGCYCLGSESPLNAVDTTTCMGGGFDVANGMAQILKVPIVTHLGDSTFFHSGIPPMINAVYNRSKITMVVLDNQTTAMTGSQPNPGTGYSAGDIEAPQIRPEEIARGCGVKFVEVVDPLDLEQCVEVMEKAIKFAGPSFVVFRRECSILEQRGKRARGEKIVPYTIKQGECIANSLPFCTATCPLHIDVRGYVNLVHEGKYDQALKLIKQKLPFPAIMGRICTHPCENLCKRGEVDESIAIATIKRSAADYGKITDEDLKVGNNRKEKVAIIGAGPAGIMAAYDLRKMGYLVTIFEALALPGGMLSAGIPEYRLPRDISLNEINRIQKMGVEIRLNTRIGEDVKLSSLRNAYNAIFIATGAHKGKDLGIGESSLSGLHPGIDFLREVNLGNRKTAGKQVVVIGGGNVAIDCARTCWRLGSKEVTVIYRRTREEMPAIRQEIIEAEKEGIKFKFQTNPTGILQRDNKVNGLSCIKMQSGQKESDGRRATAPVPGSDFSIETDMVIAAVGEQPDLSFLEYDTISLKVTKGLVAANPVTLETGIPGIFAGGDAVTGPATVIEALAAGRKAAISIDRFIRGEGLATGRESEGVLSSPLIVETTDISRQPRIAVPSLDVAERHNNSFEVETGFSKESANKEAGRCLSCGCQLCIKKLGCPAITITNGEVFIDSSQCPGCGICAKVCPTGAIIADKQ
jgi:indolepyruvate ferredoxin oxidoreductase, alpha subunit